MSLSIGEGGPVCIAGTRGEILALRNSGTLLPGVHYAITDYNRANVGAAVVKVHAVDESTLGQSAEVATTHDNLAWHGEYDIDTNRITRLEDNLGNRASGQNGDEVDRFPWGNTNWRETIVENANVFVDVGTALRSYGNRFAEQSYTDLRGATGYVYYSNVRTGGNLRARNAVNLRVTYAEIHSRGLVYADATTNFLLYASEISSQAQLRIQNQTDVRLYYAAVRELSYVQRTGGTRLWLYYSTLEQGRIIQVSGEVRTYYSHLDSYGEIRNEAGSALWQIYGLEASSRAYLRNFNTGTVRYYYIEATSRGEINHRGAATHTLYYSSVRSYGRLLVQGTATVVYAYEVSAQATVTLTAGNHYRGTFHTFARPTFNSLTRAVYGFGSWAHNSAANNINRGRDYFNSSLL